MSDEWNVSHPVALRTNQFESQFIGQFPGEKVEIEDSNIGYLSPIGRIPGRVIVTRYRLRFEGKEHYPSGRKCEFDIPLGFISKVEKVGHSTVSRAEHAYGIQITCKDLRHLRFSSQQSTHSRRPLVEALFKYAFPTTSKQPFFAVFYAQNLLARPDIDGWNIFDSRRELKRMGVPNVEWSITDINHNYEFSDTYPRVLAVPTAAASKGREYLERVGEFRSRQRIPVLSWLHPSTQASITRCAQPLPGMTNKRNSDDEKYLQLIIQANAEAHQLLIMDARPAVNAKVNKAKGGGYEENYEQCTLHFLNIHNIHIVRESLRKLKDALFPRVDEKNYLKMLDESKWLNHIQSIIEGARQIVREVEHNHSCVLVHCSDGWDRTAQLTSLAMLQLDPYYRTIEGFAVLIEKEWCSFGHKFAHRIGHGEDKPNDGERSPVFVQFIDCVWQLIQQFSYHFEFTSVLLETVLDELYACRYGTFLYNCEKQRIVDNNCRQNTISLWSDVLENKKKYLNPLYNSGGKQRTVLTMNPSIKVLRIWTQYYARHNINVITPGSQICQRLALEHAVDKRALIAELNSVMNAQ